MTDNTPPAAPEENSDVREEVRFLLHTGGINADGEQDADLLTTELLSRFEVHPRGGGPCGADFRSQDERASIMWTAIVAWWRRNVVALDPDPRYSYLDRLDGRTQDDAPI